MIFMFLLSGELLKIGYEFSLREIYTRISDQPGCTSHTYYVWDSPRSFILLQLQKYVRRCDCIDVEIRTMLKQELMMTRIRAEKKSGIYFRVLHFYYRKNNTYMYYNIKMYYLKAYAKIIILTTRRIYLFLWIISSLTADCNFMS